LIGVCSKAFYVAAALIAVASWVKPAAADQPFIFFNSHTNMCLQPLGQSTAQGVAIVQEPCTTPTPPTEAMEWVYVPNGSAGFHFENALSQLCLDARGKAEDRTPVQQWTCDQISNENWDPPTNPQSGGPVHSRVSGSDSFCLDIPGGQQTPELGMQIFRCNGTLSQAWELRPIFPFVIDLRGLNETVAQNRILLFGLQNPQKENSTNNCTSQQQDIVTDQSPEPGGQEPPGAVVTLTICEK
jgi:Ricin-type beta-trefoil lectin domain